MAMLVPLEHDNGDFTVVRPRRNGKPSPGAFTIADYIRPPPVKRTDENRFGALYNDSDNSYISKYGSNAYIKSKEAATETAKPVRKAKANRQVKFDMAADFISARSDNESATAVTKSQQPQRQLQQP